MKPRLKLLFTLELVPHRRANGVYPLAKLVPSRSVKGRHQCRTPSFEERTDAQIYASEETVEIFIEADFDALPEERRRFALVNVPRHLFSEATAATARRAANPRPASST
jgi:hypothetical protein